MLARFFAANRIPMVVNQAKKKICKMEMDKQQQIDIVNAIQSIMEPIDSLLSMYNFNRTCKYWMNSECIYNDKCIFKHEIIKINKKCKYGNDCYYQDTCLYLHPGETIQNHHNQHPNQHHNHDQHHNQDENPNNVRTQGKWQVKAQSTNPSDPTQVIQPKQHMIPSQSTKTQKLMHHLPTLTHTQHQHTQSHLYSLLQPTQLRYHIHNNSRSMHTQNGITYRKRKRKRENRIPTPVYNHQTLAKHNRDHKRIRQQRQLVKRVHHLPTRSYIHRRSHQGNHQQSHLSYQQPPKVHSVFMKNKKKMKCTEQAD